MHDSTDYGLYGLFSVVKLSLEKSEWQKDFTVPDSLNDYREK